MKKLGVFVSLLFTLLVINSCDGNPFMFNIFSGVEKYTAPTAQSLTSGDAVVAAAIDKRFLETIATDPVLAEAAVNALKRDINNTSIPTVALQKAAVTLSSIELAKAGADKSLANANDLLEKVSTDPSSLNIKEPADLIGMLIEPPSDATVEEKTDLVTKQLEAFIKSADALTHYGKTLTDGGLAPNPDIKEASVAVTALVGGMTSFLIKNIKVDQVDPGFAQGVRDANLTLVVGSDEMKQKIATAALVDSIVKGNSIPPFFAPVVKDEGGSTVTDPTTDQLLKSMLGTKDLAAVAFSGLDITKILTGFGE